MRSETLTNFVLDYLFKDICKLNIHGRKTKERNEERLGEVTEIIDYEGFECVCGSE